MIILLTAGGLMVSVRALRVALRWFCVCVALVADSWRAGGERGANRKCQNWGLFHVEGSNAASRFAAS